MSTAFRRRICRAASITFDLTKKQLEAGCANYLALLSAE